TRYLLPKDLTGRAVQAEDCELESFVRRFFRCWFSSFLARWHGRKNKNTICPYDRSGVTFATEDRLPLYVSGVAPLQRRVGVGANAGVKGSTPLRPVFIGIGIRESVDSYAQQEGGDGFE